MSETPLHTSDVYAVRGEKLAALRAGGVDPYRANVAQTHTTARVRAAAAQILPAGEGEAETPENCPDFAVAGRLVAINRMGKASFARLLDQEGVLQVYFKQDEVGEEAYALFKKLDIGDIVGVTGPLFRTKTGEISLRAKAFTLVSKALRPLPEKWHGLADSDQIYRQRYLDLITNEESRRRFRLRSEIVRTIRRTLEDRGFLEVETPILQSEVGGAAARPFITHFNSLGCDFTLRIATELHLKRLLVGGFDKVFEIGRIFRNEGLSPRHSPEFTSLEVYEAYSDFEGMMELLKDFFRRLCEDVLQADTVTRPDGTVINLHPDRHPWRILPYKKAIEDATESVRGARSWFSLSKEEKLAACEKLGIEVNPELEDFEVTNDVFEKVVEPTLIQPTFVTHILKELCPLAKVNAGDPEVLDVFEFCCNGQELAPAYSEQNDPEAQRAMFAAQAGEDTQNIDEDFLHALEYGMPPAGGMGLGIDRLVILLTGAENIRDTILFPALRPESKEERAVRLGLDSGAAGLDGNAVEAFLSELSKSKLKKLLGVLDRAGLEVPAGARQKDTFAPWYRQEASGEVQQAVQAFVAKNG